MSLGEKTMKWQALMDWVKARPWVVMPALSLIPIVGIPLLNQQVSLSSSTQQEALTLAPVFSKVAIALPANLPAELFKPAPTPTPKPQKTAAQAAPQKQAASSRPVPSVLNMSADSAIEMRVLIHNGVSSLPISTSAGGDVINVDTGKPLYQLSSKSQHTIQADGTAIALDGSQLPSIIWISPVPGGITYVGDRGYRGQILVVAKDSRLWVVNHVNLQQYLYSVVGAEVSPSWPMEALKAQAVAARSYALTYHLKPVKKDLYDLGNDEYFQVYKGVEAEADTTRQAVNATGGEFVSYRGDVVESLYAATDDIVMEAFQGKGMSQIGALGMAEQGYQYRQILASYYKGTGVARIEMDIE